MSATDYIYLDHNATTALDERVLAKMLPLLAESFGNPSSQHQLGQATRHLLESAREDLAKLLGAYPDELIFTSSATEANNLALNSVRGSAELSLAVCCTEHHSVLRPAEQLKRDGVTVHYLDVDDSGFLNMDTCHEILAQGPTLFSVAYANAEIGSIQQIKQLVDLCHESGSLCHSDMAQALGKLPIDLHELGVDFASFNAHKIYGPMGIGLLYMRRGTKLPAHILGGNQERGLRAGTENIPAAIGFAKAAELVVQEMPTMMAELLQLKTDFWAGLQASPIKNLHLNGDLTNSLANTINISFPGIRNELLLMQLDLQGIGVSTGSACESGGTEPSHVIAAISKDEALIQSALRFSFGRSNTVAQLQRVISVLNDVLLKSE